MLGEDPPLKVLDDLAALAREASRAPRRDELRVVGVGVAVPGLVDVGLRTLLRAPNLGWTQVAIGAELESRLGLPAGVVAVGNEANLAALAELWDGVALDLSSFIHVTGQVGVGAGIVIDGELYRGSRGFAGELGHMTVRPDGAPCACGARGCLETVAGLEAIRDRAGMKRRDGAGEYETAELLAQRAAAHDEAAITAIDEAAEALGIALSSAINLLDLEALVLGGSYTPLCPWLVPRVRDALSDARARVDVVAVRRARLGAGRAGAGPGRRRDPPPGRAEPPVAGSRQPRARPGPAAPPRERRSGVGGILTSVNELISLSSQRTKARPRYCQGGEGWDG